METEAYSYEAELVSRNIANTRIGFWLSLSQPGFQLTAGMTEPMFSDEGILKIKY